MIQQRLCGGFTILDRFERSEVLLMRLALILGQEMVTDRKLRSELAELEIKIFGEDESFLNELDELIKT